ncbi:MAG: M20/M25/M40 family metallo-hydrolase [Anaerolineae bacterium]|nr:M20/M25/M40 family metallo-hydrolase [Anaerolineae bacterium]
MKISEIRARLDATIEANLDSNIDRLGRLVGQPSVAAQQWGIDECADLVAGLLHEIGLESEIMPTGGSPVVYADCAGCGDRTLLFYLHYDVQPPDPLDLWKSPPFELTRSNGKLYGRGAADDKGNVISRIAAVEAVRAALGDLPCNIKFVIEGEEEIGSPHLPAFVRKHELKLAADACIWEFGGVDFEDRPTQILGMRGICYVELAVRTASRDAHSGLGGSLFDNAAWRLTWALNSLKGPDERIRIPGFYDNVHPPSDRDMELLASMPDDTDWIKENYGLSGFLKGETRPVELHRMSVFEPTCTICGLTAGYQGEGIKTVQPGEARAKVDFRLVPDMTVDEVVEKLRAHLDAESFADVEVKFIGGELPARTDPDHPFIALVNEAAEAVYGMPPVVKPLSGGSGPNHAFIHTLGVPIATAGVSYPGAFVHSPNENIRVGDFINGTRHIAYIIEAFGRS